MNNRNRDSKSLTSLLPPPSSSRRSSSAPEHLTTSGSSLHRQISLVIAAALGIFVTSSFILSSYIPSPTEFYNTNTNVAEFHSVTNLVRINQQGGREFILPKGHLRREKNDMRYVHEEIIIKESKSTLGNDIQDRKDDYTAADGGKESRQEYMGSQRNSESVISSGDTVLEEAVEKEPNNENENIVERIGNENNKSHGNQYQMGQEILIATGSGSNEEIPYRIFHILETRFMQHQPNLVQLAKARLQLFKAICLPTVVKQTAWGNFIWIIRTDPDLHVDIRRELVEMLNESGALSSAINDKNGSGDKEEQTLTYVIGSNDNYIVANSSFVNPQIIPFDIHDMFSNMLSKPDKIFAGKVEHIQSSLERIPSTDQDIVLWTRLDADDGLSVNYLKYIQYQTLHSFLPEKMKGGYVFIDEDEEEEEVENESLTSYNISADNEVNTSKDEIMTDVKEEHGVSADIADELSKLKNETKKMNDSDNEDIVDEVASDDQGNALDSIPYSPPNWMYWCGGQNIDWFITDPVQDPKHDYGVVYPVTHGMVCVTPGITIAIRGDIKPALVPKLDHDKIVSYLIRVGGKACNTTGFRDDDELPDYGGCFQMIHGWTHAVRSRTPTSAGMMGVNPDENQILMMKQNKHLKKLMWLQIHKAFLIQDDDLRKTNSYFAKHVYDIAEENARGQCTNGHSCKVRFTIA